MLEHLWGPETDSSSICYTGLAHVSHKGFFTTLKTAHRTKMGHVRNPAANLPINLETLRLHEPTYYAFFAEFSKTFIQMALHLNSELTSCVSSVFYDGHAMVEGYKVTAWVQLLKESAHDSKATLPLSNNSTLQRNWSNDRRGSYQRCQPEDHLEKS